MVPWSLAPRETAPTRSEGMQRPSRPTELPSPSFMDEGTCPRWSVAIRIAAAGSAGSGTWGAGGSCKHLLGTGRSTLRRRIPRHDTHHRGLRRAGHPSPKDDRARQRPDLVARRPTGLRTSSKAPAVVAPDGAGDGGRSRRPSGLGARFRRLAFRRGDSVFVADWTARTTDASRPANGLLGHRTERGSASLRDRATSRGESTARASGGSEPACRFNGRLRRGPGVARLPWSRATGHTLDGRRRAGWPKTSRPLLPRPSGTGWRA